MIVSRTTIIIAAVVTFVLLGFFGWLTWSHISLRSRIKTIEAKTDEQGKVLYQVVTFLRGVQQQNQLPR